MVRAIFEWMSSVAEDRSSMARDLGGICVADHRSCRSDGILQEGSRAESNILQLLPSKTGRRIFQCRTKLLYSEAILQSTGLIILLFYG